MNAITLKKILYAVLSGVILTASFPPGKLDWLVWVALVPLMKSLDDQTYSGAFKLGFITGLIHYLTLLYWIVVVLGSYGGLNFPTSLSVLLLLTLYLALFPGFFALLIRYTSSIPFRILLTAGFWVMLEYLRAKALTGFPWCLLGYSQFRRLYLIQITNLVGVYGLSFLIAASNGLICFLFFNRDEKPYKKSLLLECFITLAIITFTLIYGYLRLSPTGETVQKSIHVAVIQGNIDQSVKWNPAYQEKTIDLYLNLSRSSYDNRPKVIVWPETAAPFFFQDNLDNAMRILNISKESGADIIFGSPAYKKTNGKTKYYNRAYHLSPTGKLGYYDKVHLVPFGEYVPMKRFLPFVNRLVPAAGDFTSGAKVEPLSLPGLSAGILICFEAIFPELARTHVKKGASVLFNLTNDAWFGRSSAPYQHLGMAVFRAVENGRPLIRSANTGFSAFIDPRGKILSRGTLFEEAVLTQEVKFGTPSLTFYTRHGDIFACTISIICLIIFLLKLCYHVFIDRKK